MKAKIYKDDAGEWRWRLTANNNRVIADSGEGYANREDCVHGLALLREAARGPVEFTVDMDN